MLYSLSIITAIYHYERSIQCQNFVKNHLQLAQNLLSKICAELLVFIKKIITSNDFISRHRQNPTDFTDFTRNIKFPIHSLISFLPSLVRGSYQNELDRFFNILSRPDVPKRRITKAA